MPANVQGTLPAEATHRTKLEMSTRKELENLNFSTSIPYFFPLVPGELSREGTKDIFTISQAQGWIHQLTNPVSLYVILISVGLDATAD